MEQFIIKQKQKTDVRHSEDQKFKEVNKNPHEDVGEGTSILVAGVLRKKTRTAYWGHCLFVGGWVGR